MQTLKTVIKDKKEKSRRPGRPAADSFSVADQILKVAEILIAEKGFNSITLKDVSERSGVNSAMIAYYFDNKEGLGQAVMKKQLNRMDHLIQLSEQNAKNPEEFWIHVIEYLIQNVHEEPFCHRIHMWTVLEGGQRIHDMAHGVWNPVFKKLTHWLQRLHPDLKSEQIEARCSLFCGSFQQYANWLWVISLNLKTQTSDRELLRAQYLELLRKNLNLTLQIKGRSH